MAEADKTGYTYQLRLKTCGRIGSHRPVVLDVLDYFVAPRNDTCPEEKNAPKWGCS
jgi:hypothetical protein